MDSLSLTRRGKVRYGVLYLLVIGLALLSMSLAVSFSTAFQIGVLVLSLLFLGRVVGLLYYPYRDAVGPNLRELEEPLRTEYAHLFAEYGTPVEGLWVTDELRDAYALAEIDGVIPHNRHIFLDSKYFELYTDDERVAVVARESKLAANFYQLLSKTLVFLTPVVYVAILILVESVPWLSLPSWPLVPEILLVPLVAVGVWITRMQVYQADEFAAEQTSVETVVRALAKFEREKSKTNDGRGEIALASILWTVPSPRKRIGRLRA